MTALPILVVVLCVLAIGYRYYSAFLAARVLALDDSRITPAHLHNDGQNFHPTNKWVLFGHHFAAISGAGPLVGPVLACQFGYCPGLLWLLGGVVLGGAVQDFTVLVASIRRGGRSLAEIARDEIGPVAGIAAAFAILFIIVNALAGLGLVVVKALGGEDHGYPRGSVITQEESARGPVSLVVSGPEESVYRIPGPSLLRQPGLDRDHPTTEDVLVAVPAGAEAFSFSDPLAKTFEVPAGATRRITGSSWGTFTIACTIPIAFLVGLWMYVIRKGRIVEASLVGGAAVLVCTWAGQFIPQSALLAPIFTLSQNEITVAMALYGFLASVLPVWLLLCPRDYLSSFLKIGTVIALVVGTMIANPKLQMPAFTEFVAGGGPIVPGKAFPFLFITIMCGAISGFHALVSSGTTPKMIDKESHARLIGYGSMLIEGLVGILALIAAASLNPEDYFKINVDLAKQPAFEDRFVALSTGPSELGHFEEATHEQLRGRSGGAVSLAVGMTKIFSAIPGFSSFTSFWYHFAIMFEALFILTTVDTGTRIARFLIQELVGKAWPKFGKTDWLPGSVISTALVVMAWAYFIWTGSIDTIWPMFGIANQLLAVVALSVVTAVLINSGRARYAWVSLLPLAFVLTTTSTAGAELISRFWTRARDPGATPAEVFQWNLNLALTVIMLALVALILLVSARRWLAPRRSTGVGGPTG
ncbi:MAG TPA: carbon starvation CstA family protein [Planctomycetota bacterium]|nr:carbon starvation CstA family protein [Planctomycetota bacterium]